MARPRPDTNPGGAVARREKVSLRRAAAAFALGCAAGVLVMILCGWTSDSLSGRPFDMERWFRLTPMHVAISAVVACWRYLR